MTLALRLAAASQLLLVMGLLVRDYRRSRVTAATALLVACAVCYLALPALLQPAVPAPLQQLARTGAIAVPFAFWLAARLFFDDAFRPGLSSIAVLFGLLLLRGLVLPWPLAAAGLAMAAVGDALRRILAGAGSDLLLSRLRLRYVIVLGTGLYALLVLVAEATLARGSRAEALLSAANDVGLFLLVGAILMMILRVEPELVRGGGRPQASEEFPALLQKRLERLIEEDQVFKIEGLTIGGLAERLGEQEYKVRRLINAHLGFRNFGAFLNHYRISEARKALADPG